jgi:phage virion morphogenesis protein
MISIRISQKSLREIDNKIKKLVERIDNPRPILNDIANYMVRVTQNRLTTTKKGPDGSRWSDNSELTQYLKGRNNPNYASGALASSISVTRRDRWGFSIGSKLAYAGYVQHGVKVMKGRYQSKTKPQPQIPARPFLGFSEQNKHKIAQMMREYIRTGRDTIPEDAE